MLPPGYEPFLNAICADPEDDTVRLVFADWLDENGAADRAEFIRLQIERARLRARGTDSEELANRDIEFRRTRGDVWRQELPRLSGVNWHRFWRGFVSGADVIEWRFYRDAADTLFAATPVQFLHMSGLYGGSGADDFARSPYLTRLRGLTLSRCYFGSDGGQWFWATPAFAGLEWIEIRNDYPLTEWQLRAIIDSRALRGLHELRIVGAVDRSAVRPLQKRFGDGAKWMEVRG